MSVQLLDHDAPAVSTRPPAPRGGRPARRRGRAAASPPDPVRERGAIQEIAERHGLDTVRWWPPNAGDLLVGGAALDLRRFRSELERALGCKVAIYLAEQLPPEVRERLRSETVDLMERENAHR
jgi:hypothetical protein